MSGVTGVSASCLASLAQVAGLMVEAELMRLPKVQMTPMGPVMLSVVLRAVVVSDIDHCMTLEKRVVVDQSVRFAVVRDRLNHC